MNMTEVSDPYATPLHRNISILLTLCPIAVLAFLIRTAPHNQNQQNAPTPPTPADNTATALVQVAQR
jgi:hypothetical protein